MSDGLDMERSADTTEDLGDSGGDDTMRPSLPPNGEFTAIEPGGDTLCARGAPYRFFVYGGDPSKVLLDFQGPWGGACWNVLTCQFGSEVLGQPIFTKSVTSLEALKATHEYGELGGGYDFDNPDNPFSDWTIIQEPYCTGDLHWGDATVDYSDGLTIHHRGFVNATSVLEWTKAHYPDAAEIISAGSSMGGYGAIAQAPRIRDTYPEADVTILVDSAVGVISDTFFAAAFPKWNAVASLPVDLIRSSGIAFEDINMIDFYVAVATNYPELRIAQYTAAHDQAQGLYYMFMGETARCGPPRLKTRSRRFDFALRTSATTWPRAPSTAYTTTAASMNEPSVACPIRAGCARSSGAPRSLTMSSASRHASTIPSAPAASKRTTRTHSACGATISRSVATTRPKAQGEARRKAWRNTTNADAPHDSLRPPQAKVSTLYLVA